MPSAWRAWRRYSRALDAIEARQHARRGALRAASARRSREHRLPVQLLRDLLDAFSQDVVKKRYADFTELLDYCRRSANPDRPPAAAPLRAAPTRASLAPVGCDLLGAAAHQLLAGRGGRLGQGPRLHPAGGPRALRRGGSAIARRGARATRWRALMAFECERARAMLLRRARRSGRALPGRLGLEIRAIVAGGARDSR